MSTEEKMTIDERYKYFRMMKRRYERANKQEKGSILDEMQVFTGQHRKGLIRSMKRSQERQPRAKQRFGASPEEARRQIADSDKARAGFLRRYYSVDIDDAQLYDLCINTGTVREDTAVQLIVDSVKAAGLK